MSTPLRVLIVEDDAVDRMACRRAFAAAAATDSGTAFELLEADSGELLLSHGCAGMKYGPP